LDFAGCGEIADLELLFIRFFGVALVAHVVGNWAQPDFPSLVGILNLVVGLAGLGLNLWPRRPLVIGAAVVTCASVLAEMPFTGNHWVVAGLASLAIILTGGNPGRYFLALRWIFVIFYGFAAFAKLNSGFFDPSVSCAVFYANQSLDGLGLGPIPASSSTRNLLIWLTAAIELAVVPLLVIRRTRFAGLVLATAFHLLISFDLNQHFYDFTAVLIALLISFLPERTAAQLIRPLPGIWWRSGRVALIALSVFLVVIAVLPSNNATLAILERLPFVAWSPIALYGFYRLVRSGHSGDQLDWRLGWVAGGVVLLTLFNGITPYTEIKTAYGFNMYANLFTAQGRSNHFLIRNTVPLRDDYVDPVEIIESSDPGLEIYEDMGYLIAYPQFRRYLAAKPTTAVKYRRGSEEYELTGSSPPPDPGPSWWRFFPLRALDTHDPPRCQSVFLPAL
jgi:hypothetical protein